MIKTKLAFLFLLAGLTLHAAAQTPPPTGEFLFDGKHPYVGTAIVSNVTVRGKALYLNGKYSTDYWGDDKKHAGYTAVFKPPKLRYEKFTVAVKLRPENISRGTTTLLAGGVSDRWLVLTAIETNRLQLTLNNGRYQHIAPGITITNGAWIILATSFDLDSRKVTVYSDGNKLEDIQLPPDFTLDVIRDEKFKEYDDVWTFTNYSDAGTFQGLVGGLLSFDTVLSDEEVKQLFLNQ